MSRYFHVNALGLATDQTGAPVEGMLPFGDEWQKKFARLANHDNDLGLYMTTHRLYDPGLGRWMTPDPLGGNVMNPQFFNRYAYVNNNPTTLTDPLGLSHPTACWTFPGDEGGILPGCEIAYGGGAGLSGGNPADPCSDSSYAISNAECGGPAGLPSMTPWGEFPILPPWGGMGGGGITIGGASSPGQPTMIVGGDLCGPLGCVSPPFQNFLQEGEGIGLYELLKAAWEACKEDPEGCGRLLEAILELGKHYAHPAVQAARAWGMAQQCQYAPVLCIETQGQQNNRPWWTPSPTKPMPVPRLPIPQQPTIVFSPALPDPGGVVPVH